VLISYKRISDNDLQDCKREAEMGMASALPKGAQRNKADRITWFVERNPFAALGG